MYLATFSLILFWASAKIYCAIQERRISIRELYVCQAQKIMINVQDSRRINCLYVKSICWHIFYFLLLKKYPIYA